MKLTQKNMKCTWPMPELRIGVSKASRWVWKASRWHFRYQHVGIPNAKFNAKGFALQWNTGLQDTASGNKKRYSPKTCRSMDPYDSKLHHFFLLSGRKPFPIPMMQYMGMRDSVVRPPASKIQYHWFRSVCLHTLTNLWHYF